MAQATPQAQFQCPLCQQALAQNNQGLQCANKHHFDLAKEGYVNLLVVQHKGSKTPGDAQSMVMARRGFLESGHYQFLRDKLIEIIKQHSPQPSQIIDAGCGEGYYTNEVARQVGDLKGTIYGIDIAKPAIRYAAKRKVSNSLYAVASSAKLPFKSDFADIIYKVFAPTDINEVKRVLQANGVFISIVPGPKHLFELKQIIYPHPKAHQNEICPAGFERFQSHNLNRKVCLRSHADINNLTQMTPFAWKLNTGDQQQLLARNEFEISFDFVINLYKKTR